MLTTRLLNDILSERLEKGAKKRNHSRNDLKKKLKKVLDKASKMWYSISPANQQIDVGNAPCELNNVSERAPKKEREKGS